jgi:hypothetical protein
VLPSICQACHVVVGPGLPHQRFGMPSSARGTSAALTGTGQVWVHFDPDRVAIGMSTPSPRRTAMVTAGRSAA